MKKYFDLLGLSEGASQDAIQAAYDRLKKELDPSKNSNADFFIEEYSKISEAYNVLKNNSILSTKSVDSEADSIISRLGIEKQNIVYNNTSISKKNRFLVIGLFFFVLSSIVIFLFYSYSPLVTEWYYNKGLEKYKNKEYYSAFLYFSKSIIRDSNNESYYFMRGEVQMKLKNDKQMAIDDYSKSIEINPGYIKAIFARGEAIYVNYKLILKQRDKLFEISKDKYSQPQRDSIDYMNYLLRETELKKSISDFDKVIKINPSHIDSYYNRGKIKSELYDFRGALLDFEKAISLDNNNDLINYEYFYVRGILKAKRNDHIGAIEDFTNAILLKQNKTDCYFERGQSKFIISDYRGAISDYHKVLDINKRHKLAYFNIGSAYDNLNNKIKACEYYSKALELGYIEAYNRIKYYCY